MAEQEDSQFGGGKILPFMQHMLDNAVPIWEVLGLSEELYMVKYVKPFVHKVCEILEEIAEDVIEVVHAVEEVVGQADEVEVAETVSDASV